MTDWIRQALTRKIKRKGIRGNQHVMIMDPDERLVHAIQFAISMTGCLVALEIAHMILLRSWSSEIFVGISSLVTFVSGVFVGQKAT